MSMYETKYDVKPKNGKKTLNVTIKSDCSKELTDSILDILLRSCLNNENFLKLGGDT